MTSKSVNENLLCDHSIESYWVVCNVFFSTLQTGSASFYPPVSLEITQQLKGHLLSIIRTLPEDLQFVLKNS